MKTRITDIFYSFFPDPESIELSEADIDDPSIHVDMASLSTYKIEHLKKWLIYRGDRLHNIETLKSAQVRVLEYFENGTNDKIIDPTTDKIWIRQKAQSMGVILKPTWKEGALPSVSPILADQKLKESETNMTGWSKSLDGMPNFSVDNIKVYQEKITKLFCENSKLIKKNFIRGQQFMEERFIDLTSTFSKSDETIFCVKTVIAASLRKLCRWAVVALSKTDGEIIYAHCACVGGKAGTCAHSYALMKTILKWVIDRRTVIPEEKACTSQRCAWNQVQMRKHEENMDRMPLSELTFKSPPCLKRKKSSDDADNEQSGPSKESKGISSSLYESRKNPAVC